MNTLNSDSFDAIAAERRELDILLNRGLYFDVPKRSLLRFFGKPDHRFVIRQPHLGTLDHLSREYIDFNFSAEQLNAEPLAESKRLVAKNTRRCARVVAIAVLDSYWKIKLLTPLLSRYFLWHITPSKLMEISFMISRMSNMVDFTSSIGFLSVNERTTTPAPIEKPEERNVNPHNPVD